MSRILHPKTLDDLYDAFTREWKRSQESKVLERKRLRRALGKVQRKIRNITEAIAQAGPSPSLLEELKRLEREKGEIEEKIRQLQRAETFPLLPREKMLTMTERIRRQILKAPIDEKRLLLRNLIARVEVRREGNQVTGEILYHFPFPFLLNEKHHSLPGVVSIDQCPHGDSNPGLGLERAAS